MAPSRTRNVSKNKPKRSGNPTASSRAKDDVTPPPKSESAIPLEFQQLLLNVFRNSFSDRLDSNIGPMLQEVKQHLYNRDFLTAFGRNDYLEAYAARWSPSRALGYAHIFHDLSKYIIPMQEQSDHNQHGQRKIVCLGGGAGAEIVAFGGFLHRLRKVNRDEAFGKLNLISIDIADWSTIIKDLQENMTTSPPLSKYASATAKAVNAPLVDAEDFRVSFQQMDILDTESPKLSSLLEEAGLITIMFTLNELYSTSMAQTQIFLLNLTSRVKDGTLLLVVDSPGSYSTIKLNGAEKMYPMQWLLDHTLLEKDQCNESALWEKLESDESRWFRLLLELRYPIELENMRYQLHLYKRRSRDVASSDA